MRELTGKYGSAKIFTDLVEEKALAQISKLLDQEFIKDSKIRIMPDVHAGAGCTIGTTMTITDKVCPNLVGVDIGCGMHVVNLGKVKFDLVKLDKFIRDHIPSGFNIRTEPHSYIGLTWLNNLRCCDHIDMNRARLSLGTLGGGNHFIELDKDDDDNVYLVVHSGSRHLGLEVAGYYQKLAEDQVCCKDKESIENLIAMLKSEGRHREIQMAIERRKRLISDIPKELSYISGTLFDDYINDMQIIQRYAAMNRCAMIDDIITYMEIEDDQVLDEFETVHNYIDTVNMILRKGAVSAKAGELLLIPINMRDGSLICVGKGNPDWNYSAPHGAGRLMSRAEARKTFSVEAFKDSMDGIYTTSISAETLDECPMAYKPIESIIDNIGDTVEIEKIIRPIYNFKAGE